MGFKPSRTFRQSAYSTVRVMLGGKMNAGVRASQYLACSGVNYRDHVVKTRFGPPDG